MKTRWVFDDILEGLSIIRRYCNNERSVGASLDTFWAGSEEANPEKLDGDDFDRLHDLGWYWAKEKECWKINL